MAFPLFGPDTPALPLKKTVKRPRPVPEGYGFGCLTLIPPSTAQVCPVT